MASRRFACLLGILALSALLLWTPDSTAYIDAPPATLGRMCHWSTHILQVRVEQVDRSKGVVIWRKLRELKGKWPGGEFLIQQISLEPEPKRHILDWAEAGKTTLMFFLESYKWGHTYVDRCWYAAHTPDWRSWNANRIQPQVLRTYCGRAESFISAINLILGNKVAVVPCVAEEAPKEPVKRKAKVHRLRASLALLDYNAKRDYVGPGGDEMETLPGMPGFSHRATLPRVGPDAQAVSVIDFDGDGKLDLCLLGAGRLSLVQNSGVVFAETTPTGLTGGRTAVWADYNGDGKPDLLVAASDGPRLHTNQGNGLFRDDRKLLPRESAYNLTSAAWIDYDGDGKPDILLGNGWHGLRLYRNVGSEMGGWRFEDVSAKVGLGPDGLGSEVKGDTLTVADVDGDGRPDVLYGAGTGLLLLNKPGGFVEAKGCGISYAAGQIGPVFGDFTGTGHLGLFVPQVDGACKLFANDGKGGFTDVTAKAGDLAKPVAGAACAAWADLDNDGRLDLLVGCLRSPNRFFRNNGDGTFADATKEIGLHKRIYNTRSVAVADLNQDGALDLVFNNEGQDSVALLGDASLRRSATSLLVRLTGTKGLTGATVRVFNGKGLVATREPGSSLGRGGQSSTDLHFALKQGRYRLEASFSSGVKREKEVMVGGSPLREAISAD